MAAVSEADMAKTSKELSDQVALATDLLAERRWTRAGEVSLVVDLLIRHVCPRGSLSIKCDSSMPCTLVILLSNWLQALSVIHVNDKVKLSEKCRTTRPVLPPCLRLFFTNTNGGCTNLGNILDSVLMVSAAVSRAILQVIEEKERELVDCIAQNYSKLKGRLPNLYLR